MSKHARDSAVWTYLEFLPEAEALEILATVSSKMRRSGELRLSVLISIVWCAIWMWIANGFGPFVGFFGTFAAMIVAATFLWPIVG